MVFVCHVTLQGHVIKALYNLIVRKPVRYVTTLRRLADTGTVVLGI